MFQVVTFYHSKTRRNARYTLLFTNKIRYLLKVRVDAVKLHTYTVVYLLAETLPFRKHVLFMSEVTGFGIALN